MDQKISACIVLRNEESLLERCLKSIQSHVDEIIVVHDGPCTDKSLDIAKKYHAKIFVRDFIGEAEYHRPFSYEKASGGWILQIDADEYIGEQDKEKIRELITTKEIDGYHFFWPYPSHGGYIRSGPFAQTYKACLFRKSNMYMVGISHEYPRTFGTLKKIQSIQLHHKPLYNNYTINIFRNKWILWAKLQARQIKKLEDAPTFGVEDVQKLPVFPYYDGMRKHPVIYGIYETGKYILLFLYRGILLSGWQSVKIALFEICYLWAVRMYLFKKNI